MAASAFAVSVARANNSFYSSLNLMLSKRFFHSAVSSSLHPLGLVSSTVGGVIRRRPFPYAAVRLAAGAGASRLNPIRCRVHRSGDSPYSPINSGSGSGFSDKPPTEMAPLFPGCDYEHWLIVMDKPGGENATKEQMIDCYIKTLAKVVGSDEEAIKKIYNVSCERYFGFGCEIDEETSNKLEGLPGVLFVLPDSYVDAENKDYGERAGGDAVLGPEGGGRDQNTPFLRLFLCLAGENGVGDPFVLPPCDNISSKRHPQMPCQMNLSFKLPLKLLEVACQ